MAKEMTVEQAQKVWEAALASLKSIVSYPAGFHPVVQFRENDRKKPKNASIQNWSAAKGEIRITFEPGDAVVTTAQAESAPVEAAPAKSNPQESPNELAELLAALQEAETAPGRSFVSLTWFRNDFLPKRFPGASWANDADVRQSLISQAIRDGWILTSKVPNPKAPLYPTTSIRLNRQKQGSMAASPAARFRPVPITGQPLSATILADRGTR